jgi:outer membrane protein TolC
MTIPFSVLGTRYSLLKPGEEMKPSSQMMSRTLLLGSLILSCFLSAHAVEPMPLKRVVELALKHSTVAVAADADVQRALASYHEVRNQYIPQAVVGSGLGQAWGYPLSLEGSAPSIFNVSTQSALINPSLRDFVRAAKIEMQATGFQSKDQRDQVIQDTVVTYAELGKWESSIDHLQQEKEEATKSEQVIEQRIQAGVDSELTRNKARLTSARVRLRLAQAEGAIDVLRNKLSHLTGLPAASIEADSDTLPALPEIKQEEDLPARAVQNNSAVHAADFHANAQAARARGEHRALWPTADFAAQYALLSTALANYQQFFVPGSFQHNNATVGVVLRFPFINEVQRAKAQGAMAEAIHARQDAQAARNQVSEQTLKLQRTVQQLAAAQEVADLGYQIAQANLSALKVRVDAGSATLQDMQDANDQVNERFNSLQDTNFELEKARIALLRATGDLAGWVGVTN